MADNPDEEELAGWYRGQYWDAVGLPAVEGGRRFRDLAETLRQKGSGDLGRLRVFGKYLKQAGREPLAPTYRALALTASAGGGAPVIAQVYVAEGGGAPSYITASFAPESRDGEFRKRLWPIEEFFAAVSGSPSCAAMERCVLDALDAGALALGECNSESFPPEALEWVRARRTAIAAASFVFVAELGPVLDGTASPHFPEAAADLLRSFAEAVPDSRAPSVPTLKTFAGCAKLIPLFVRELFAPGDLRYSAWRETAVARVAADLVLNCTTPGLPFHGDSTYIVQAGRDLFSSKAMRERYERSRAAAGAVAGTRGARRALAGVAGARAGAFDRRLQAALEYAQSFLSVSDTVLLNRGEMVGVTLGEIGPFSQRITKRALTEAYTSILAGPADGARFLFELAFSVGVLHARGRAAHTDLHVNNLALYTLTRHKHRPDEFVLYCAGARGEADSYVFPAAGVVGGVIDFSRAVVAPGFAGAGAAFFEEQAPRVVRALHARSPEAVSANVDALRALAAGRCELVFPLLCAADFAAVGAAFLEAAAPWACAEVLDRARARAGAGQRLLEEGLELVARRDFGALEARGLPGPQLLRDLFGDHSFPRWAPTAPPGAFLGAAFNAEAPLRYSAYDAARAPPWADPAEIARHLGPLSMAGVFAAETGGPPRLPGPGPELDWGRRAEAAAEAEAALDALPADARPGGEGAGDAI